MATSAMATVEFGRHDDDPHKIHVTTYDGPEDEFGTKETVLVTDEAWDSAPGRTNAEKIEHILQWSGAGQTEHDREHCHILFDE